jgi:hypothetical protein
MNRDSHSDGGAAGADAAKGAEGGAVAAQGSTGADRRATLGAALLEVLADWYLADVIGVIVTYAHSPTWDRHFEGPIDGHFGATVGALSEAGTVVLLGKGAANNWESARLDEALGGGCVVSFDVQLLSTVAEAPADIDSAIGVVTSACTWIPGFGVGNYQSFSVTSAGYIIHNESAGGGEKYFESPLQWGDVIRTEIDLVRETITFYKNGQPGEHLLPPSVRSTVAFAAGTPRTTRSCPWHDGEGAVRWPSDAKFYPCVSSWGTRGPPSRMFRLNHSVAFSSEHSNQPNR